MQAKDIKWLGRQKFSVGFIIKSVMQKTLKRGVQKVLVTMTRF